MGVRNVHADRLRAPLVRPAQARTLHCSPPKIARFFVHLGTVNSCEMAVVEWTGNRVLFESWAEQTTRSREMSAGLTLGIFGFVGKEQLSKQDFMGVRTQTRRNTFSSLRP